MEYTNKRLFNEINKLINDKNNNERKVIVEMTCKITKVIINNVSFIISTKYPFQKPEILIHGNIPYLRWLVSPSIRISDFVNKIGIKCLCCSTMLCDWSPAFTISNLITEIDKMNGIKREVKYRMLLYDILIKKTNIEPSIILHHIIPYLLLK